MVNSGRTLTCAGTVIRNRWRSLVASEIAPGVFVIARTLRGNWNSSLGRLAWNAVSAVTSTDIKLPSVPRYTSSLPSFLQRAIPALPFLDTIHFPDTGEEPGFAPGLKACTYNSCLP